jgi:hypothetical protein
VEYTNAQFARIRAPATGHLRRDKSLVYVELHFNDVAASQLVSSQRNPAQNFYARCDREAIGALTTDGHLDLLRLGEYVRRVPDIEIQHCVPFRVRERECRLLLRPVPHERGVARRDFLVVPAVLEYGERVLHRQEFQRADLVRVVPDIRREA